MGYLKKLYLNFKRLFCNHETEEIGKVSGLKPLDKKKEMSGWKFTDYHLVLTYCKKCGLVSVKKVSYSL